MERIEKEKRIIRCMIRVYCKGREHEPESEGELCPQCSALLDYAQQRLTRCKFGNEKTTCQKCPIHCYKKDMKQQVREVMRYAGPRLLIYHPIETIRHIFA